jgi:hypothetical protein
MAESEIAIDQLYYVTFAESGETKTFIVLLRLSRMGTPDGHSVWRIIDAQGGVNPDAAMQL